MDRIEIRGLRVHGHHGVYPSEQRDGQPFVVDVDIERDLDRAARSDDLRETVHYGELTERLAAAITTTRFDLIEALAGHLADLVLSEPGVAAVEVRVAKPHAPIDLSSVAAELDEVAVVLRRERRAD